MTRWIPIKRSVFAGVRPSGSQLAFGTCSPKSCISRCRLLMRTLHAFGVMPPLRGKQDCTPVLVVPGYTENAGTMWLLGWRLARAGFNPILIDFPSTLHRIESNVDFLGSLHRADPRRSAGGAPSRSSRTAWAG